VSGARESLPTPPSDRGVGETYTAQPTRRLACANPLIFVLFFPSSAIGIERANSVLTVVFNPGASS